MTNMAPPKKIKLFRCHVLVTQDSSHHQDEHYIFGLRNPYKPLFATGILGGG